MATQEKEKKLLEAVKVFVDSFATGSDYNRWNTTSVTATITKVLVCLDIYCHNKENPEWVRPLYAAIFFDYESKKTDGKQYVENFYKAVMKLEETMRKDGWEFTNNAIDDNAVEVKIAFMKAIESNFNTRSYNLRNYDFLKKNKIFNYRMLSDFDTNFRGDIQKYHNINDTYFIIETKKFNDDKEVMDWETMFYPSDRNNSYCYSSFNEALLGTMFGRFSGSAIVLLERVEQERKEAEEIEKQKQLKKSLTKK